MTVKLGLFTMPFHHPDRDYGQILAKLREGDFFISTGEVLLTSVKREGGAVDARVKWTFPLSHGVIVWGDGVKVMRDTVSFESMGAFIAKPMLLVIQWLRQTRRARAAGISGSCRWTSSAALRTPHSSAP